jgi:hypothetical protein
MRVKPRDLIFLSIVVVSVGGLYFLSTRAKVPPAMPANRPHVEAVTRAQCLSCHPPAQMEALQQAHKHPSKWRDEKVNCLQCHKPPPAKARLNSGRDAQPVAAASSPDSTEELHLWLRQRRN